MTQTQVSGLVTRLGVPLRGPFLSLPLRAGVGKLSRAPTRRNAGVKESKLLCTICGPGQCARTCGGSILRKDPMEARPTLKQQACSFCPQRRMPPLIPAPSDT